MKKFFLVIVCSIFTFILAGCTSNKNINLDNVYENFKR